MKPLFVGCMGALALAALSGAAHATPVPAGGTVVPTATATLPTGLTFVASQSGTISPGTFTATYTSSVYRTAAGTLDFVYDFSDGSGSRNGIESFSAYNFGAFTTDVSYLTNNGNAPVTATRTATGTVGFNFAAGSPVAPGTSSDTLIIATNATAYDSVGVLSLQDGSAGSGTGFEPIAVAAAPEPGPWALMLGGVGAMGLRLRRRRTAALSA